MANPDLRLVDLAVIRARGAEVAVVPLLADQRLLPGAELLPQRRYDRLPIGGILARLVVVEADDVAAALDPHLLDLQRRRGVAGSALGMHDPIATGPGQDLVLDLVLRSHPGAQDVLPASLLLLQCLDRLLADNVPVGHD